MKLGEIMTTRVITVAIDDHLETARALFEKYHFHHLLVLDEEGTLVGIISDRDLLKALSPFIATLVERTEDLRTLQKRVHQIMSRRLITASKEHTIKEAAVLMLNNRVSCLPVVSANRTIEGIVSWKDILKWLVERI